MQGNQSRRAWPLCSTRSFRDPGPSSLVALPSLGCFLFLHQQRWLDSDLNSKKQDGWRKSKANTGISLACLPVCLSTYLPAISVCARVLSLSCVWLCDPLDCSPPGSSVRGILQARILEWVAISSSRGSSRPRDQTWVSRVSCIGR